MFEKYDIFRIRHWIYHSGYPIIGYFYSNNIVKIKDLVLLLWVTSLTLAFIYSFNDYTDKRTKPYFLFPLLLLIICIFLIPLSCWGPLFLFILMQVAYTSFPFRLKRFPFIGTLCCSLAFPNLFLVGYFYGEIFYSTIMVKIFFFLSLLTIIAQLLHEVNHYQEDIEGMINTTAVYLGKRRVEIISLILLGGCYIFNFFLFKTRIMPVYPGWLFSLLFFIMGLRILSKGINFKTWVLFRFLGTIVGIVWILSLVIQNTRSYL